MSEQKKEPKPPPVFVAGVQNINPLTKLLNEIVTDQYLIKALGENQVKIQPKNGESYTKIVKALTQKNTEFHTYKLKQDKLFRVVLKNMHYSTDTNDIKQNIEQLGHEVINVWNAKQNRTKKPLPLFFIDLKPKENNKDIYNINLLMNTCVVFEAPRVYRNIPQCIKCQRFGHIKNFCQRNPRCVKCTGPHHTSECSRKNRDDTVKCVNCNENHPANYRGCIVHKQLQEKIHPKIRDRNLQNVNKGQSITKQGITYAQMVSHSQQQPSTLTNGNLGYTVTSETSNDLSELKIMMRDLITQMGTIMNLITTLVSKMT